MASGVEFDEDKFAYGRPQVRPGGMSGGGYTPGQPQERGITGWLIRHHIVKSYNSAQMFMLGVVVVNIIITIVLVKLFLL